MTRRLLCFGLLLVLLMYMTGCLYPPEPCDEKEKAPAPAVKDTIQPAAQPVIEEKENAVIEEIADETEKTEQKEENKTSMGSSEFTVNPTLDDSALTNSS